MIDLTAQEAFKEKTFDEALATFGESNATDFFTHTPAALRVEDNVYLNGGGQYNYYKIPVVIDTTDPEDALAIADKLGAAQVQLFHNLAKRRGLNLSTVNMQEFIQGAKSRFLTYYYRTDTIRVNARFTNAHKKPFTVYINAATDPSSPPCWIKPEVPITVLRPGDRIRLSGRLRSYFRDGSYGTSFYISGKVYLETQATA